MQTRLKTIADSESLRALVFTLILLNALCLGVEVTPGLGDQFENLLGWIFGISQAVFVIEITVRVLAHAPSYRSFFADSWNRFDFAVVLLSLLPVTGDFAIAARVLRVLRVLRVVSITDTLRSGFAASSTRVGMLASMLALTLLLAYIFAIAGVHLLGKQAPAAFGGLFAAMASVAAMALVVDAASVFAQVSATVMSHVYFAAFYATYLALAASLTHRLLRTPTASGHGT